MRILVLALIALAIDCHTGSAQTTQKPNIVFVLADDLGWSELGCYGNRFNETPHLDAMARQGLRFTDAYAAAPVCSPYRASFLTGQYPARIGIQDYLRPNSANYLPKGIETLPLALKRHGYATGMIGKWHLTGYRHHGAEYEYRPTDYGFDWNTGSEVKSVGNGANTWPYVFRDQALRWIDLPHNRLGDKEYLTDRLNFEALEFIERNKDKPFFLFLSHYAPHTILNGRSDLVAKYIKKQPPGKSSRTNCYLCEDAGLGKGDPNHHWAAHHNPHLAAMLESVDDGIGKIRNKLKTLDLLDNTIFIFTSDNGGETNVTSNSPLRGGKSQLYEGGIRVPLIVSWPKQLPAGKVNRNPTVNVDFFPTLLTAMGQEPKQEQILDGVSMLENWKRPSARVSRDLYWHYPLDRPHFLGGKGGGAIREGDWKLIDRFALGEPELYLLSDDPSERINLASRHPDKLKSLHKKLLDWREQVSARVPSPPFISHPRQLYFADHFSGQASERLWYTKDWAAEEGVLQRIDTGSENTRIFLRDARYQDALIRFDFQFQKSTDIRLVTGSNGNYNAVIHIRPDHFYIQTALDKTGPYFPFRHGECAYPFDPQRWYTMTVEFVGDQLVAHIDPEHLAYARHPIIDKERTYFAFQVDDQPAAFDNVQILTATKHAELSRNLQHVLKVADQHPVPKSLEEEFKIQKVNAHEHLYQSSEKYRQLIKAVDELDAKKKEQFPAAFQSHKDVRKKLQARRKMLLAEDGKYKELLYATYRLEREVESFLVQQRPEIADWPNSRRKSEIERLRRKFSEEAELLKLFEKQEVAQKKLESNYPDLFITDQQITAAKKVAYDRLRDHPEFKKLVQQRADAWNRQQDFLFANDEKLAKLKSRLKQQ